MPSCHVLKSVLSGFLGTYTSRNSDYNGYWLFGLLVDEFDEVRVDLLGPERFPPGRKPWAFARRLAIVKFQEQLAKAGFQPERIHRAELVIQRLPDTKNGVLFTASVVTDDGHSFQREESVLVGPYDARFHRRSTRRLPLTSWLPWWTGT
jgi:hypothetical protein